MRDNGVTTRWSRGLRLLRRLSLLSCLLAGTLLAGPAAAQVPAGLVAEYGMNEGTGTTLTDSSGRGNAGTVSGATWTAAGRSGAALAFDGVNDRVNVADAASLDLSAAMTIEAWVFPTNLSGWRTVVLKETAGGLVYGLYAHDNAPRPAAYINIGGSDLSVQGAAALPLNAWSHLAVTYDGAAVRLYVNGTQVGTRAVTGPIRTSTGSLRIGGNAVWGEYFSGRIDEVRIYNRALSVAEIQADMTRPVWAADATAPTITGRTPAAGATGVATTAAVTATFSEAMDAATISGSTLTLQGPGGAAVAASVAYNATTFTATLTPTSPLTAGTTYTATVRGGTTDPRVKDVAGNALAATSTWTFTTAGSAADATAPTITGRTPAAGATGVATTAAVTATFSEAMDAATIAGTTVSLQGPGGAAVAASVAYNATTFTATLTPTSPLTAGTTYTASVRGGATDPRAKDLVGNALAATSTWTFTTTAAGGCTGNPIVCENQRAGNPPSEWDISGAGDLGIQGFATDISVNRGGTVRFKIETSAAAYRLDIYRMGYYGGQGARKVATVSPSAAPPQSQPLCLNDAATGLIDCGNWAESASWTVPADAVSGIYFAKAIRSDTGGASHILFIVRDDAGTSDIVFQTSDTTWHAYNNYGGNSLYMGQPAGRAYKVSYNRPFLTRNCCAEDLVWNAEYPMVRWLERNGYHVSYISGVDTDRAGARLLPHKLFLSVGHDEYWSGAQRANVEAARNAGVHLAFFSGNEVFWKTRWEPSIDGSNTPYRTMVSYKETHAGAKIDPLPNVWTGTWRDARFSPPADGGRPENGLTGTIFMVNGIRDDAMQVPEAEGKLRFWRNTSIATLAPGQTATLPAGVLGYEWDEDLENGARPAGLIRLSSTTLTLNGSFYLLDNGSTFGSGIATHALTLYRHSSGALVFGAGTVQWSWGLDAEHDRPGPAADARMQQATVNLFADMGVQPATLQAGLVAATQTTDTAAPTATITFPAAGATVQAGVPITISGTASDAGGRVAGVEVSVDGGATWRGATGRESWSFAWTPAGTSATILARAVDDSANLGPAASVTVGSWGTTHTCPCTIWPASAVPGVAADPDTAAVELGVKFRSNAAGVITGLRYYKSAANTGTHTGRLWSATGTLLGTLTFTGETASGWQQASFSSPIPVQANTVYVASYHAPVGRYAADASYFAAAGVTNGPLEALRDGVSGGNGVYAYGPAGSFPAASFGATNYWVDVVFSDGAASDTTPPTVTGSTPAGGATDVPATSGISATFSEAMDPATITTSTLLLRGPGGTAVAGSVVYTGATRTATFTPASALAASTLYTATVRGGTTDPRAKDLAGNALATDVVWSFTTAAQSAPVCPCTIWLASAVPGVAADPDTAAVELGVKFRTSAAGAITGLRYYKSTANTGTHTGRLWSAAGTMLGSLTFTGESAAGWQQASFASPIPVQANTVYVASYHAPVGRYAADNNYFASAGVVSGPLEALRDGVSGGNGVYAYGPAGTFPFSTYTASNYWVDVVFATSTGADTTPPTLTATSPTSGATGVELAASLTVTFSEAMDAATISGSTVSLQPSGGAPVAATVTYAGGTFTATLTPSSPLAAGTGYTLTVQGGAAGVRDVAGNPLAATASWSFTTGGAGTVAGTGPLLLVTSTTNPFSSYYAEILRAEGLNLFNAADLSAMTSSLLAGYDVVLLGETALTPAQVSLLTGWVNAGGRLIAMRPDKQLAPLLGLTDAGTTLTDAYLLMEATQTPAAGLVSQTIQFKGTADRYTLSGATRLARLYTNATTATSNPAATWRAVGTNGGSASAFTYDLARSVVYLRQGNPAWAGQDRDGLAPIRSNDLFFGGAEADWVNLGKVAIPQADEQQRLLANLILWANASRKPIPRFWYLPRDLAAAVLMTGDDHGSGGTAGRFDAYLAASPPGCSVVDWECVRGTSYLYAFSPLTAVDAQAYEAAGFEVSLHANTQCSNWTPASLAASLADDLAAWRQQYPGVADPRTHRLHCMVWSDYASLPEVQLDLGIRLDVNYYYWPGTWIQDRPGLFTGSGFPMRFARADGTLVDVYQATTQMTDESGQSYPFTVDALLDRALGPEGYYGIFTANMHADEAASIGSDAIVASAQARGVPVVSARQVLTWLDGRNASTFQDFSRTGNVLRFTVSVAAGANGLRAMLPLIGQTVTSVVRDGAPVTFSTRTVKGIPYAVFPANPGSYEITLQ